ncbi:MAG: extracellular solute-binding protein [Planctomycetes bacterium]|nr:extracellular solute-binding protein [Planctomycetota bacterium]
MQWPKKAQRKMVVLVYKDSIPEVTKILVGLQKAYPEYEWVTDYRSISEQCKLLRRDHKQPWTPVCLFPITFRALHGFARDGCLTPLDGAFSSREKSAFAPQALDLASFKGQMFAVPEDISPYALIARRDLLKRLGLKMPETWAELERQLPILSKMCCGRPVCVEIPKKGWDEGIGFLSSLLGAHGVPLGPLAAALEADSQAWKDVFEYARRIQKTYGWLDGQVNSLEDFLDGDRAYCFAWPGRLARLPKETLEKLAVGPVPRGVDRARRMVFCKGTGWCVPRGTLAPDLAVMLLKTLVDPKRTKTIELAYGHAFPAQHALWHDAEILRRRPFYAQAASVVGASECVAMPNGIEWDLAWTAFADALKEDVSAGVWLDRIKMLCGSLARLDVRHKKIRDAICFVEGRLNGIRRVEDVARHLQMHPKYFGVLFKKETGTSFPDWLTRRRMEKAREKLPDPTCTIKALAQTLGYRNSSVFCQVFKRYYKVSATEMRRRLIEDRPPTISSGKLEV